MTAHSHITTSKKAHQFTLTKQATRVHITARQLHMAKQATYATAHSTPLALAQHTSTGMALHFNLHSNCIWQNKLHMQQHVARHLHQHSTLHCTSTGTAIAYGKTSYICDSTQHTICIGRAHFNWHGTAFQLVQQLHMAKQATCVSTHSTPFALAQNTSTGTAWHFSWCSGCVWQTSYICDSTQPHHYTKKWHINSIWLLAYNIPARQLHMANKLHIM